MHVEQERRAQERVALAVRVALEKQHAEAVQREQELVGELAAADAVRTRPLSVFLNMDDFDTEVSELLV